MLKLAICQFAVGPSAEQNGEIMRRQMGEAAELGADVAHFPECALSGYPKADYFDGHTLSPDLVREEIEAMRKASAELEIGSVFGTISPRGDGELPLNSDYVVSNTGDVIDRYDKRFITQGEVGYVRPGDRPAAFEMGGITCGIIICYEKWFPELFRDYKRRGVQLIVDSIHSQERDHSSATDKSLIGDADRALWIAHARLNHIWISVSNHSRPDQDNTSFLVDPDGQTELLPFKEEAVRVFSIDPSVEYWDPSGPFRDVALNGGMRVPE